MTIKQAGIEGDFHWFFAKVENRDDPLQLGRVQVRCFNLHTDDKMMLPTDMLPWATPIQPVTSAAFGEVGSSPTGILKGSVVWGFFADGREAQIPMIVGTLAGIPTVNGKDAHDVAQRARGIDNLENTYIKDVEPPMAYSGKYPYVKTLTSESEQGGGHILEVDDTPGHERLLTFHKKGTYVEINQDGRIVIKAVDDSYFLTVGDGVVYCGGNLTIVAVGSAGIAVGKDANIEVIGNLTANVGGNMTINCAGDSAITTIGKTDISSESNLTISSNSDITISADGNVKITGSRIDLN